MKFFKSQRASSVVGIALDGERLEAVVVRRSGGSVQVRQTVSAAMALSPLTGDPELVGREIRNHLDAAGVREKSCVVCLPLTWVLTLQAKVPEMPEADLASYLQIEAERGFTSGHESLFITRSLFKAPNGDNYATLLAVPRNHLNILERVLRAAKLKPLMFAMGISAMQSPTQQTTQRVLALALSNHGLELQVSGGGGVIALRSLDAAVEVEGAVRKVSADLVARELRITLGQLPGGFSDPGGAIKIFGNEATTRPFITEIAPRLTAMGLRIEPVERPADVQFDATPAPEMAASPVLALAAAYVRRGDVGPDFLPPKVTPWKQFVDTKLSTQKLAYAGGAAAFVLVCVGGIFGWQQFQIMRLDARWNPIANQVATLTDDQQKSVKYQAWFDPSCRALVIWKNLAYAMPAYGTVIVKSVDIRDLTDVQCQGTAQTMQAFNTMRDALGKLDGVVGLHSETRGLPPTIQYTIIINGSRPENYPMETKNREKLLLIVVGIAVGLYVLNWLVFTPVYRVWEGRQNDIKDLRKKIDNGIAMVQRKDVIESNWTHMDVNTLSSNPTMAESQLFKAFAGWALNSGVTLVGQKPEVKDSDDPDHYKNEEWRADVTGNEQQIERFLYAVESSPMGLKVEEVEMNARDDFGRQLALGLTVSGLILIDSTNTSTTATQ